MTSPATGDWMRRTMSGHWLLGGAGVVGGVAGTEAATAGLAALGSAGVAFTGAGVAAAGAGTGVAAAGAGAGVAAAAGAGAGVAAGADSPGEALTAGVADFAGAALVPLVVAAPPEAPNLTAAIASAGAAFLLTAAMLAFAASSVSSTAVPQTCRSDPL